MTVWCVAGRSEKDHLQHCSNSRSKIFPSNILSQQQGKYCCSFTYADVSRYMHKICEDSKHTESLLCCKNFFLQNLWTKRYSFNGHRNQRESNSIAASCDIWSIFTYKCKLNLWKTFCQSVEQKIYCCLNISNFWYDFLTFDRKYHISSIKPRPPIILWEN